MMLGINFAKRYVITLIAIIAAYAPITAIASTQNTCIKVVKSSNATIILKNTCSMTLQLDYYSGEKLISRATLKRSGRVKLKTPSGKASWSACRIRYAKTHNGRCDPRKRASVPSTSSRNTNQRSASGALKHNCIKLISATGGSANFVNGCKQDVYFKFDGGGQSRITVGEMDGRFFAGSTRQYGLTGETFYWKYCDMKAAANSSYSCAKAHIYSHETEHDHKPRKCLEKVVENYQVGNMIAERILAMRNTCGFSINVIMTNNGRVKLRRDGVSSEGYPYWSSMAGNIVTTSVGSGGRINVPASLLNKRGKTVAEVENDTDSLVWGACRAGSKRGTYPYFISSNFGFRCSILSREAASSRKVKHPNFN